MRLLIAVLLSVALIGLHQDHNSQINKSEASQMSVARKAEATTIKNSEPKATEAKQVAVPAPPPTPPQPVTATCQSEIAKYDWSQPVALAVAKAESGLDPQAINNTPATGDYSVGCFQVNIYGRNALTRPSEIQLKDPSINVAWAYKIYSGNGKSFNGQWGVCRQKVACY